jgi:hypothetical protein
MSTLGKEESGSSIQTPQRSIFDVPAVAKEPISEEGFRSRLLKFIISSNQPFSLVEEPDFRELINYTSKQNPLVAVSSRRTIRSDLEKLHGQEKANLRKFLNSNESKISFIVDGWTSSSQIPFLGIIVCWIDDSWELQTRVLDYAITKGTHSGVNLANDFLKVISDFGLAEKLLAITADNAKNIDTMITCVVTQVKILNAGFIYGNSNSVLCPHPQPCMPGNN